MSMTGELYRITPSRLGELLKSPDQVEDELYPADSPENCERNECSVDKTWNAIDFVLQYLCHQGKVVDVSPLTGGNETGAVLHYGPVWYRTAEEVQAISQTLSGLTKERLYEGYDPRLMKKNDIYPDIWDRGDEEFNDYLWPWFKGMVDFYREAAEAGDAILIHLA